MTCAPSEDSDQHAHPPSLIRVFALHFMGSLGPKLSSGGREDSDQTVWVPRLIWVFANATLLVLSWCGSCYEKAKTKNTSNFHISCTVPSGKGADRDKVIYDNTNRMPGEKLFTSYLATIMWRKQKCRYNKQRRWATTEPPHWNDKK